MDCDTKYPIVLMHAWGIRDEWFFVWGKVKKRLEKEGAKVYFGGSEAAAPTPVCAREIAANIDRILKETGAEKVNLIGYSKGGLDGRYLISRLGMDSKVASLTTVCTPHNGSLTLDKLLPHMPQPVKRILSCNMDILYMLAGDKKPDTYESWRACTTAAADDFNALCKNSDKVYYQSYAGCMKSPISNIEVSVSNVIVKMLEGDNDGFMTPENATWGDYKGLIKSTNFRGVAHTDILFATRFSNGRSHDGKYSNISDFFVDVVSDLKSRGF